MQSKKRIPFDFILEEIASANPYTKPMFGCHGIYAGDRIVLIVRKKEDATKDNGVWLATTGEHHATLRKEMPSLRSIGLFGPGETGWQVIPEESEHFEEDVFYACRLVLADDPRIGKVPKARKKRTGVKTAKKGTKNLPKKSKKAPRRKR